MKTTALVAMFLLGSIATVRAQTAAPQGSTGTDPDAMLDLAVDLAATGDGLLELNVRPSQSFVVRLDNRAPGALYRIKADLTLGPHSPRPPAAMMNRDYELAPVGKAPSGAEAGCEPVYGALEGMLAARDEAAAREKAKAFEGMIGGSVCPRLAKAFSFYLKEARKSLVPYYRLKADDSLRLSVERLDPATKAVARAWRVQVTAAAPKLAWADANEEAWIVGEVSRRIVEMAQRARRAPGKPETAPRVEITATPSPTAPSYRVKAELGPGARFEASVVPLPYVWAPSAYEPLAKALIAGVKPGARTPDPGHDTAATLLKPTSLAMEQENQRISARLAGSMLDGGAQGQAALLLATLALREAAGEFYDARPALCRTSAHLAMARVLGGGGVDADLAEAALLDVALRQRDAVQHLDVLERGAGTTPATKAWLRALRMRATGDWRLVADPAKASLLEQIELYRATERSVGSSLSLDLLERMSPEFVPDWGRITLMGYSSVEEGNRFATAALPVEVADLQQAWKAARGTDLPGKRLADALGAKEAGADYRIIDWPLWASFFERHLCHAAQKGEQHLSSMLGLPEEGAKLKEGAFKAFDGLELRPLLAIRWAAVPEPTTPAKGSAVKPPVVSPEEACRQAVELVRRRPDRVTAGYWGLASKQCFKQREDASLPAVTAWFSPALPRGTAYDLDQRVMIGELNKTLAPETRNGLPAVAPFERTAIHVKPASFDPRLTVAQLEALYGPLVEYDLSAMRALLDKVKDVPAQYRARAEKVARLNPDSYFALGDYLADRDMDDAAAAAFEKGVEKARDRVGVSNEVGFLVNYYFDRGRTEDALRIARMAADVYSAAGLFTLGRVFERMGKYAEAEEWYQKVVERYKDDDSLDNFYIRYEQRVGDGRHKAQAVAALARLFPQGLQKVSLADLIGAPGADELLLDSEGVDEARRRFGIREGDVIVAADGYRVRNWTQYFCVRSFSDDPETRIVVWRGGRYLELKGKLRRSMYGPAAPRPRA